MFVIWWASCCLLALGRVNLFVDMGGLNLLDNKGSPDLLNAGAGADKGRLNLLDVWVDVGFLDLLVTWVN